MQISAPAGRIGFISLGCPKALVDSERILTQLKTEGYGIVPRYSEADLVIVNTCGFIDAAIEESLDTIDEALSENGKVIVTGCLGKNDGRIRERFPDVLAITGPQDYTAVMSAVHAQLPPPHDPFLDLVPDQGLRLTPRHYAYLKISEGCNHKCRFCIIPDLRGKLMSRGIDDVMLEAERLARAGVKELLVVAQDTSAYGVDIRYRPGEWRGAERRSHLTDLCRALGELDIWVRLHYVYPYPHVDDIIPLMAEGNILPYLDIPLQHGSPAVLKRMRRPAAAENTLARIRRWREICPELILRSTFIVGFPGETDAEFNELLDFIEEAQLDRVGCFEYSPVEGAAANALPDPVPAEIANERKARFMAAQERISQAKLEDRVGDECAILVDEADDIVCTGRSYAEAPGIDGVVHLPQGSGRPGEIVFAEIMGVHGHDLMARPLAD
ncbi:MAG: 30S ribosomal protein S12 methylthiotransferase RimO [Oceanococcaceae bacterium]